MSIQSLIQLATSPINVYISGSHHIFIIFVLSDIVPDDEEEINLLTYLHTYLLMCSLLNTNVVLCSVLNTHVPMCFILNTNVASCSLLNTNVALCSVLNTHVPMCFI